MRQMYFFNLSDAVIEAHDADDRDRFFTAEEISAIKLYPETPAIWEAWESDEDFPLWVVYDPLKMSDEPALCANEQEARDALGQLLNVSIYERVHNM